MNVLQRKLVNVLIQRPSKINIGKAIEQIGDSILMDRPEMGMFYKDEVYREILVDIALISYVNFQVEKIGFVKFFNNKYSKYLFRIIKFINKTELKSTFVAREVTHIFKEVQDIYKEVRKNGFSKENIAALEEFDQDYYELSNKWMIVLSKFIMKKIEESVKKSDIKAL